MSNIVEFAIRIKDFATGPFQKIAQTGVNSFTKIQQNMDKLAGRSNVLKSSINDLDKQISALQKTRAISLDGSQIGRINKQIDGLQAKKDKLEGRGHSSGLCGLLGQGLAIAGIGSLAFLGKDVMQKGMERQMNLTSLQTMLGSAPGLSLNNQLRSYAQRSIYGGEVFNEAKLMAGAGVKAHNIMPVMSMIGDIANGSKERMQSLALAFSETSTRGNLNGMNERMFLQGGLFNPLEQLHKMTGESMAALKQDMSKGKIGIDLLVKAMEYATGPMGRWHDSMKKLQGTDAGKWVTLMGTLSMKTGDLGIKLMPIVGMIAGFGNALLSNTPALYGIAAGIGAMTAAWALYTIWTERAAIWQGILAVLAWWPLAAVGALAAGITYLCLKYDNWGKSMMGVWGIAKNVGEGIYDVFKFATDDIGTLFDLLGLKIKATFEFVTAMMANVGRAFKLAKDGDFAGAGRALLAPIKTEAGTRADALSKAYDNQRAQHVATLQKLFNSNQFKGLDFSLKNPKKTPSISDIVGKYTPDDGAPGGGVPSSASEGSRAITGGGVRTININVQKFQDKTEIHTMNLKESAQQIEEMFSEYFLKVLNSAAVAAN